MIAERRCAARSAPCHAVAHGRPVVAARAQHRAVPGREDHERAALGLEDVGAALRARALLGAARTRRPRSRRPARQHGHDLQREGDVAVEVLVQGVLAALA